jgi:pyruvate/2-oxoglutarate dehydrogenase complex dihydrolipoamide acyltransferase (E2) component
VVEGEVIVIRSMAPLFVRADHRLVNGYQTAEFVGTLRNALQNPEGMVLPAK